MSEPRTQSGLSLKTLLIAASASACAAIVVPMLWRPGTVFAAAMTPIIVTIVSEVLKRPVEAASAVATRRTTGVLDQAEDPFDPLAPPSAEELAALPEATRPTSAVHRRKPLTGRQWRLAVVTGLVAFAAVAVVFTASELLAGDAVSSRSRTTFFGGTSKHKAKATPTPDPSATATPEKQEEPEATATPTPTPTPTATATPAPGATVAPTPTVQAAPQATPPPAATPVP